MANLIDIQPLVDISALALQSAFIKNEKNGVSLIFIAKPESAKTSTVFEFKNLKFVSYYDEITQKKLIDEFLPDVRNGIKKTIIIPDLINCIEKQKSTRDQFLNMLKSGIDDTGIVRISTQYKQISVMELLEGLRFNMLTGITTTNWHKLDRLIKGTGLESRLLPFSYDYPINLIQKIFELIEGNKNIGIETIIPKIHCKPVIIPDNPVLFKNFEMISATLGMQSESYGIRTQTNLQRLAKANAILSDRKTVTKEDIEKVLYLAKWINYDFNSL